MNKKRYIEKMFGGGVKPDRHKKRTHPRPGDYPKLL